MSPMLADCTAMVLAGGNSHRMGQDKANMALGERTLLQSVIATLQPMFAQVIVSVRQPRPEIDLEQVCDAQALAGPLAGLAAALERSTTPWLFAVACDMPFITPELIGYLALQRVDCQAVVPVAHGFAQPLAAFYAKNCLGAVQNILSCSGKHSLRTMLECLQVRYVNELELRMVDSELVSFFDLDTPQDVAIALKLRIQN